MDFQKLPLSQRLNNLKHGCMAYPEYVSHSIQTMAETPLRIYLNHFDESRIRLSRLLQLTPQEEQTLTYRDAARRIAILRKTGPDIAAAAAEILDAPLRKCYQERKDAYGKPDSTD